MTWEAYEFVPRDEMVVVSVRDVLDQTLRPGGWGFEDEMRIEDRGLRIEG